MEAEFAPDDFAQPAPPSFLLFVWQALGFRYGFGIPAVALLAFVLALILVLRGRGPYVGAALIFIVPMPFLLGLLGALDGLVASYTVVAYSAVTPKPSELALGNSMALVTPLVGLIATGPAFFIATVGLFIRSLLCEANESKKMG